MCKMTRQHFQFIAEALGGCHQFNNTEDIVREFASLLAATNPAFDRVRFFKAVEDHRTALQMESAIVDGDANFEAQRLDDKYGNGCPADYEG